MSGSVISAGSEYLPAPALLLLAARVMASPSRVTRDLTDPPHSRQKRQLMQVLSLFQNMDKLVGSDPEDMYDMLWAVDQQTGCALKLTCSLASLTKEQARPGDMLLLRMFGKRPFTVTSEELKKPAGIYKYSAFMGAKSMNQETCDALFKACPMSAAQMVPIWRGVVGLVPSLLKSFKPSGK